MVQVWRGGQYVRVVEGKHPSPDELVQVLNQREFESLPEALAKVKTYTSTSKYQAWNIAEQIDKTKGTRRKNLKITLVLDDGGRERKLELYHQIKTNKASSYQIFRRINQEVGLEGFFLYDKVGGKILADRRGTQVTIKSVRVDKVV